MAADGAEPRLRTGSLRRRVVLPVLALLLAVIVALCLLVNIILSHRLYADARNQISERARYAATLSSRGLSAQDLADDLTGQGITASVSSGGTVTVGRDHPPGQARPPGGPGGPAGNGVGPNPAGRPAAPAAAATTVPVTVHQTDQALFVTLTLAGGTQLQLVSSLAEINRTLTLLHGVELGTAGATLILATLALVVLVGAALAPLRRMRLVADRIRTGARGVRLHPTRPGTDLGRTALALDAMLESLETAEVRARDAQEGMRRLLADVSHDLRTPIAGVVVRAEQALHHDPGRRAREDGLVELIREGRRAARLVDDLLLMTRLDAGEPVHGAVASSCDAQAVIDAAVEGLRRRRPDVPVRVTSRPAVVGLDADQLTRILTNLLDNAAAAAGPGGPVSVRLEAAPGPGAGPGDTVVIDVADHGPGVPECDRERIFDRLVRLDPSRHTAGSGLGLPIARGLARTVGGEVSYLGPARADGLGAVFRVELPGSVALAGATAPADPAAGARPAGPVPLAARR